MARYFMSGTKYESYEQMMMSTNRNPKFWEPQRKKNYHVRKGGKEKQRSN